MSAEPLDDSAETIAESIEEICVEVCASCATSIALMKETISTKSSLSAEAALRIASTLSSSEDKRVCNDVSAERAVEASAETVTAIELSAASLVDSSVEARVSNEVSAESSFDSSAARRV